MDWHSRYVISWELSISMEADFCIAALQIALSESQPQIFNTEGPQFTSEAFIKVLEERDIVEKQERLQARIFVERL